MIAEKFESYSNASNYKNYSLIVEQIAVSQSDENLSKIVLSNTPIITPTTSAIDKK